MQNINLKKHSSNICAYLILWSVVFVWGTVPLITKYAYEKFFSPIFLTLIVNIIAVISLLFLCLKRLKFLNRHYFLVAIPSGLANALANLFQKIGLQYTTPSKYAFLENLSCVVVPILVFLFVRKKPNIFKIVGSLLCLSGAFLLSGMELNSGIILFGKGEILCACAGLLYGVNITVTGLFAKKLDASLYVFIQNLIFLPVNIITLILFSSNSIMGDSCEPLRFVFGFIPLVVLLFLSLISNTLCWQLRTRVSRTIDPTVIGVIMPFSAVITMFLSVIFGMDKPTLNLMLGAILNLLAVLLSTFGDFVESKKLRTDKGSKASASSEKEEKTSFQ